MMEGITVLPLVAGESQISDDSECASLSSIEASSTSSSVIDLPPEWEFDFADSNGRLYYIDHDSKDTSWLPPSRSWKCCFHLPYGWEIAIDKTCHIYYINHNSKITTYKHPNYDNKQYEVLHQALQAKRRKIYIKRNARDGFGFVAGSEKPVIIRSVISGSPADGQLLPNDQIFSINGQIAYNLPQPQVISMIRSCTDTLELEVVASEDLQDVRNQGRLKSALMSRATRERRKSNPTNVRFDDKPEVVDIPAYSVLNVNVIKQMIPNVLKIFLENGQTKSFQYNAETTVQEIFNNIVGKLLIKLPQHFALVLIGPYPNQFCYLIPEDRISQIINKKNFSRWECRLQLCFAPRDPYQLLDDDPVAFEYLYEQTRNGVVKGHFGAELKYDVAMRLAALQIHEVHSQSLQDEEVKFNLKDIEKEYGGLEGFLPRGVVFSTRKKDIKKALTYHLKLVERIAAPGKKHLEPVQARLHYLKIASETPTYGGKTFSVTAVNGYNGMEASVDQRPEHLTVVVSAYHGISTIVPTTGNTLSQLVDFDQINGLVVTSHTLNKHHLKIFVKGKKAISFIMDPQEAEDMAFLVSGYNRILMKSDRELPLFNLSQSIPRYKPPKKNKNVKAPPFLGEHRVVPSSWSYVEDAISTLWVDGGSDESGIEDDPLNITLPIDFRHVPPSYGAKRKFERPSFRAERPRPALNTIIKQISSKERNKKGRSRENNDITIARASSLGAVEFDSRFMLDMKKRQESQDDFDEGSETSSISADDVKFQLDESEEGRVLKEMKSLVDEGLMNEDESSDEENVVKIKQKFKQIKGTLQRNKRGKLRAIGNSPIKKGLKRSDGGNSSDDDHDTIDGMSTSMDDSASVDRDSAMGDSSTLDSESFGTLLDASSSETEHLHANDNSTGHDLNDDNEYQDFSRTYSNPWGTFTSESPVNSLEGHTKKSRLKKGISGEDHSDSSESELEEWNIPDDIDKEPFEIYLINNTPDVLSDDESDDKNPLRGSSFSDYADLNDAVGSKEHLPEVSDEVVITEEKKTLSLERRMWDKTLSEKLMNLNVENEDNIGSSKTYSDGKSFEDEGESSKIKNETVTGDVDNDLDGEPESGTVSPSLLVVPPPPNDDNDGRFSPSSLICPPPPEEECSTPSEEQDPKDELKQKEVRFNSPLAEEKDEKGSDHTAEGSENAFEEDENSEFTKDSDLRPKSIFLADLQIYIPSPPKETTEEIDVANFRIPLPPSPPTADSDTNQELSDMFQYAHEPTPNPPLPPKSTPTTSEMLAVVDHTSALDTEADSAISSRQHLEGNEINLAADEGTDSNEIDTPSSFSSSPDEIVEFMNTPQKESPLDTQPALTVKFPLMKSLSGESTTDHEVEEILGKTKKNHCASVKELDDTETTFFFGVHSPEDKKLDFPSAKSVNKSNSNRTRKAESESAAVEESSSSIPTSLNLSFTQTTNSDSSEPATMPTGLKSNDPTVQFCLSNQNEKNSTEASANDLRENLALNQGMNSVGAMFVLSFSPRHSPQPSPTSPSKTSMSVSPMRIGNRDNNSRMLYSPDHSGPQFALSGLLNSSPMSSVRNSSPGPASSTPPPPLPEKSERLKSLKLRGPGYHHLPEQSRSSPVEQFARELNNSRLHIDSNSSKLSSHSFSHAERPMVHYHGYRRTSLDDLGQVSKHVEPRRSSVPDAKAILSSTGRRLSPVKDFSEFGNDVIELQSNGILRRNNLPKNLAPENNFDEQNLRLPSTPPPRTSSFLRAIELKKQYGVQQTSNIVNSGVDFVQTSKKVGFVNSCKFVKTKTVELDRQLNSSLTGKSNNRIQDNESIHDRQSLLNIMRSCARSLTNDLKEVVSVTSKSDIRELEIFVEDSMTTIEKLAKSSKEFKEKCCVSGNDQSVNEFLTLVKDVLLQYREVVSGMQSAMGKTLSDPTVVSLIERTNQMAFALTIVLRKMRSL